MISLEGITARDGTVMVRGLSLWLAQGAHALIGGRSDGGPLLLAVMARRVPAQGKVDTGASRAKTAYVPLEARLPDALRVDEALHLAASIRGEKRRDPASRLAVLGVKELAPRKVKTLSQAEARTVALVEALTCDATAILLDEPLVRIAPQAEALMPEAIRVRARAACVVIATASPRDAAELAPKHVVLSSGVILRQGDAVDPVIAPARLQVIAREPRLLLTALAVEDSVLAVETRGAAILLQGETLPALAGSVARAVLRSGAEIIEMRPAPPALDELRAAAAGAAAAYHAAYQRQQEQGTPS